jgi:uncharacterized protein YecE (DUF72 family)
VRTSEERLRHYAQRFDLVEVDSPFYRLPTPETAALLEPLVPLVEFRHASWLVPEELPTTLELCRRNGLAFVSLDTPGNALPRVAEATHELAYVRFHGRNRETWFKKVETSAERFDWLYERDELAEWVEPLRRLDAEATEVHALFNNNRDDFAPRSAQLLRGLLDEAGIDATGGIEPEPAAPTLF